MDKLTPELLLYAYRNGIFPMAVPEDDNVIHWFSPEPRAILPLADFHVPKSLARVVRQQRFEICCDRDFEGVMKACAAPRGDDGSSWISNEIVSAYTGLHELGQAHSVECWLDGELVGGLYGVALAGAFFGESMFHRQRDASKVALVHLVELLRRNGFVLLDVQFMTSHLARFGAVEVSREEYLRRLELAMAATPSGFAWPPARGAGG